MPLALQISAVPLGGNGLFGKGFTSRDAGIEPIGMYLRRPLTGTPVPDFDIRRVYLPLAINTIYTIEEMHLPHGTE
jgi:hypothetical protein